MDKVVSIYKSINEIAKADYITISDALRRIKDGKHKEKIERIRNGEKTLKATLPVVLFSGIFVDKRADENLKEHSGFIVVDFDHVGDVENEKDILALDPYIYAVWVSPSGDGVKGLVKISNPERHRDHYRSLIEYFDKNYGLELDSTGINESRACFESYDPLIIIKEEFSTYGGMISEVAKNQSSIHQTPYTDYSKLNIAANMIRKAEEGKKHETLLRASRLTGGFIAAGKIDEEEAFRIIEREISMRNVDSIEQARNTIRDGLEMGKRLPLREVIGEEDKIKREMRILDGDMSFISSDDNDFKWIQDYKEGNLEIGLSLGHPKIDEHFVFKREFVMINGHSNVGKTTFSLWMMTVLAMKHDLYFVLYSSENTTASVKNKIMQFVIGKYTNSKSTNYAEIKAAWDWVNKHFVVIDNREVYSYFDILLFAEKIHRNQPIDGIFIDPYNSLRIDMSNSNVGVHEYHYEAASEFLTFSNRINSAVWVNAHSFSESQRRTDKDPFTGEELTPAPMAQDTEHGGKWVNRSDCFLTIHRHVLSSDRDKKSQIELHVRKVREVETGGSPTPRASPLIFDFDFNCSGYFFNGGRLIEPLSLTQKGVQVNFNNTY